MGTSTASAGPGSNVSLDPPWLDEVATDIGTDSTVPTLCQNEGSSETPAPPDDEPPITMKRRATIRLPKRPPRPIIAVAEADTAKETRAKHANSGQKCSFA